MAQPTTRKPGTGPHTLAPSQQMALQIEPDPVPDMARRLFLRSALFQRRWASFEAAWADPIAGKALRLAAQGILRNRAQAAARRQAGRVRRERPAQHTTHGTGPR